MTRIIAGRAGGLRLQVPTGPTRPTSERVREAVFSRIDHLMDLTGARVLDLYAGSGALGLEALSRGAQIAVLVDFDAKAVAACRANASATRLPAQVVRADVGTFVRTALPQRGFDLVLLDPPYATAPGEVAGVLAALCAHLAPGALVVVELGARAAQPTWPPGLSPLGSRRYGDTAVWFAAAPGPGDSDPEEEHT